DGLTHYQEYLLGTDPHNFTLLGAASRLRSETLLMPLNATADGSSVIQVLTVVRDAQGHFLPNRPVTWTTRNLNLVLSANSGLTDEQGVAQVEVRSGAVTSGVIEIMAEGVIVGRPLMQFV